MTDAIIRAALEQHLAALDPAAWPTVWENVEAAPTTRHQRVQLLWARHEKRALGRTGAILAAGIFQVAVYVPSGDGPNAADVRAAELRTHFRNGLVLVESGIAVHMEEPYRASGQSEPNWYRVPVSCPFHAYLPPP